MDWQKETENEPILSDHHSYQCSQQVLISCQPPNTMPLLRIRLLPLLALLLLPSTGAFLLHTHHHDVSSSITSLSGWVQRSDGEWEWAEDDPDYVAPAAVKVAEASATPQLPSGEYRPKQSLGQNFLRDGNTVVKIIKAFHRDATKKAREQLLQEHPESDADDLSSILLDHIVELGPGAGALTDKLVETYGPEKLQCIEIDDRSVELLGEKHPQLRVMHADVLQVNYPELAREADQPLAVIGNLPYYITSQILFALADASHLGAVECATVTMQWEVGLRMVAPVCTKDYGILSVVFQLYASTNCHFKIPPTVFYPKPKVDSALIGLHFVGPQRLRQRLGGVEPAHLRRVVTTAFQQRRKTIRNSLRKLTRELTGSPEAATELWGQSAPALPVSIQALAQEGDPVCAQQQLPEDWASKRPEELTPGQFVELTRLLFGPHKELSEEELASYPLGSKVWRKLKHGSANESKGEERKM